MTMRRILIPLLLLLSACDSLADFGSDCSAEKTAVRLREGGPASHTETSEVAGDYTESWRYDDSSGTRYYTFRWGVSYDGCQVDGPGSFSVIPLTL
jgi:hypothetical protein